jgi:hypothetical protein
MKNLVLIACTCFFIAAKAQNCDSYYPLIKGKEYELQHFNAKDKKTSRVVYTVKDISHSGTKTEAQMNTKSFDDKDKETMTSDYKVICDKDVLLMDMRAMVPASQTEAYKNMEVKAEGKYLETPSKLQAGQKLPDAEMTMDMIDKKTGTTSFTIVIEIKNRIVEGKESVTTPAGTFECYKIKYEGTFQSKMVVGTTSIGMTKFNYTVTEYLSPGKGLVKSETYSKSGKPAGYSLLTKF